MKRLSRYICMLLAVMMLLSIPVFAKEEATPWSSAYFTSHSEYLYRTAPISFQVWFDIVATNIMEELGASTVKIQRSFDGETGWETVKTFSMDDSYYRTLMICENTGSHMSYVAYTGVDGYYYRAKITYYAKKSGGMGYYTAYTGVIQL